MQYIALTEAGITRSAQEAIAMLDTLIARCDSRIRFLGEANAKLEAISPVAFRRAIRNNNFRRARLIGLAEYLESRKERAA